MGLGGVGDYIFLQCLDGGVFVVVRREWFRRD